MGLIGIKQNSFIKKDSKVMVVSMIVNIILSFIKIISGILGSSGALIADGIHSLSDLITDVFAIIGNLLSKKPADDKHPLGHGKLEYLTSMAIGIMVLFIGFSIIYNSFNHELIVPSILVIIVTLFTILLKLLLSSYVIKKGKEYNNNILIASGRESGADVISSLFVLLSTVLMQFSNYIPILRFSDLVVTIIVGIFIVRIGFELLKENISMILGERETDNSFLEDIRKIIMKEEIVINIDSLNLIKYGSYFEVVGEISMNEDLTLRECHDVVERIEKSLLDFDERNKYINIHVNPYSKKGK